MPITSETSTDPSSLMSAASRQETLKLPMKRWFRVEIASLRSTLPSPFESPRMNVRKKVWSPTMARPPMTRGKFVT